MSKCVFVVVFACVLLVVPSAQAGTLSRVGAQYRYTESDSNSTVNQFRVTFCTTGTGGCSSLQYAFVDNNSPITVVAGSGCDNASATVPAGTTIFCPVGTTTAVAISLGGGSDTLTTATQGAGPSFSRSLIVSGGPGADTLTGGGGDDTLEGDDDNDTLNGGAGDDTLNGGNNSDVMNGGTGTDRADYSGRTSAVAVDLGTESVRDDGSASDGASATTRDQIVDVETAIGGKGNDTLRAGTAVGVRLEGRGGDDTLTGGSGDDVLSGGVGSDTITGVTGTDTVDYSDRTTGVNVTLDGVRNDGNADDGAGDTLSTIENIIGGSGNDVLVGSNGVSNRIDGGAGNDLIRGGQGTISDTLIGGAGTDAVDYGDRSGAVNISLDGLPNDGAPGENDALSGFEIAIGSPGNDTMSATIGGTTLRGGSGDDRMSSANNGTNLFGEGGNDQLTGGATGERLDGGPGNDTINGLGGADIVLGGDGDDNVEARDGVADNVDCGPGAGDSAFTDSIDRRANCELPAVVVPTPTPTPTPKPKPKPLKTFAVTVFFHFPDDPTRTTLFDTFTVSNVPKGAKVKGNCLTKRGKSCKGRLRSKFSLKQKKRKTIKARAFTRKRYPAGTKLEVVVSKKGFKNQIKTVFIRDHRQPGLSTRCQKPGKKKRTRC